MLRCKIPFNFSLSFFVPLLFCDILCHRRHFFGFCC
jgi:hypothetical protein